MVTQPIFQRNGKISQVFLGRRFRLRETKYGKPVVKMCKLFLGVYVTKKWSMGHLWYFFMI